MLGGDVVVVHGAGFVGSPLEHLGERGRDGRLLLGAIDPRLAREPLLRLGAQRRRRLAGTLGERPGQLLVEQGKQQMLGVELGVAVTPRELLSRGDGLL
jgi:hypothetical protein